MTNFLGFIRFVNGFGICCGESYYLVMNGIFGVWGFGGIKDYTECYPCKFIKGSLTYNTLTGETTPNGDYTYDKEDADPFYSLQKCSTGNELRATSKILATQYSGERFYIFPNSVNDVLNSYDIKCHKLSDKQFGNVKLSDLWFCLDWKER